MKKLIFTICLLSVLTIGAGCSSKPQTTAPTTTPKVVIKKQPAAPEVKDPAIDFCQNKGFEAVIRFDQKTQTSKTFCQFKDGSECVADEYMNGKCAPGKGAVGQDFAKPSATPNDFAICTNEFTPVCGADGVNYTNICLAQMQGIKIAHKGVCTQKENIQIQDELAETGNENIIGANNATIMTPNNWLPIVKDFILSSAPSDPPAFIERCVISGNTYYYKSDGCADCETIIYNSDGEVSCYPSNDIDNSCPINFTKSNRSKYCERIWQDPR